MDDLTDFFKILSDETRLRILVLLYHQEYCVCELCGILGESQPKVSKHLAKLRDLGLVKDVRREQFIYYSLNLVPLFHDIVEKLVYNASDFPVIQKDIQRSREDRTFLEPCTTKVLQIEPNK